jgi:hypothetical protein
MVVTMLLELADDYNVAYWSGCQIYFLSRYINMLWHAESPPRSFTARAAGSKVGTALALPGEHHPSDKKGAERNKSSL